MEIVNSKPVVVSKQTVVKKDIKISKLPVKPVKPIVVKPVKPIVVKSVDNSVIGKVLNKQTESKVSTEKSTGKVSAIGMVINLLNGDEKFSTVQIVSKVKSKFSNMQPTEIEQLIKEYA
jgi:hypothetical protein